VSASNYVSQSVFGVTFISRERLQLEKPPIGCLNSLVCSDWMSHVVVNTLLEMSAKVGPHGLQLQGTKSLETLIYLRSTAPKFNILTAVESVTCLHLTSESSDLRN
jgi:hypothetical protein